MKKKLLASAITIVMLVSLMVTATFALFTSSVNFQNNSVKAGKVELTGTIALTGVKQHKETDYTEVKDTDTSAYFAASDTAPDITRTVKVVDAKQIVMTNVIPGDYAQFDLTITNKSSVAIKYIVILSVKGTDISYFDTSLATLNTVANGSTDSQWVDFDANDQDGEKNPTYTKSFYVGMDSTIGNEAQDSSFTFDINVFAVQANGTDGVVLASDLNAINNANNGDSVILLNNIESTEDIVITKAVNLDLNSYTIKGKTIKFEDIAYAKTLMIENGTVAATATSGTSITYNYPLATGTFKNLINKVAGTDNDGATIFVKFSSNTLNIGENVQNIVVKTETVDGKEVEVAVPATLVVGGGTTVRVQENTHEIKLAVDVNATETVKIVDERATVTESASKIEVTVPAGVKAAVSVENNAAATEDSEKIAIEGEGKDNVVIGNVETSENGRVITVATVAELASAIKNQKENDTIKIKNGNYLIKNECQLTATQMFGTEIPSNFSADSQWLTNFAIFKKGVTLIGESKENTKLSFEHGSQGNTMWQCQSAITIIADNVTVSNLTLIEKSKVEDVNKIIDIWASNVNLSNLNCYADNKNADGFSFSGSICVTQSKEGTINFTNINGQAPLNIKWFAKSGSEQITFNVNNYTCDIRGIAFNYESFRPLFSDTNNIVNVTGYKVLCDSENDLQTQVLNVVPAGTRIELADGTYTNDIIIAKNNITITGATVTKPVFTGKILVEGDDCALSGIKVSHTYIGNSREITENDGTKVFVCSGETYYFSITGLNFSIVNCYIERTNYVAPAFGFLVQYKNPKGLLKISDTTLVAPCYILEEGTTMKYEPWVTEGQYNEAYDASMSVIGVQPDDAITNNLEMYNCTVKTQGYVVFNRCNNTIIDNLKMEGLDSYSSKGVIVFEKALPYAILNNVNANNIILKNSDIKTYQNALIIGGANANVLIENNTFLCGSVAIYDWAEQGGALATVVIKNNIFDLSLSSRGTKATSKYTITGNTFKNQDNKNSTEGNRYCIDNVSGNATVAGNTYIDCDTSLIFRGAGTQTNETIQKS